MWIFALSEVSGGSGYNRNANSGTESEVVKQTVYYILYNGSKY